MPQYVMLQQPNKLEWLERAANQTGNFLYQLALAKVAHNWRMDEQDKLLEARKIEAQEQRDAETKERMRPKNITQVEIDGKVIGVMDEPGRISLLPAASPEKPAYKIGQLEDFEVGDKKVKGVYTGSPEDNFGGLAGWKKTGIEGERYRPPQTNVKMELPVGETAATKKLGEQVGEAAGKRLTMAQEARTQNVQLDQFKLALSQGAKTGFGEETMMGIKSAAQTVGQAMGVEVGDIAPQESIRRISNEMALRLRNPESGLGLTGNTSNQDLNFLKESVPGLGRTERGNLLMIDSMQRVNEIKVAVAKEQSRIIRENKGVVPNDMDERLMEFVDKYPVFKPHERTAIKKMSQKVINTGTHKDGRKTVQFEDGTWEYAN